MAQFFDPQHKGTAFGNTVVDFDVCFDRVGTLGRKKIAATGRVRGSRPKLVSGGKQPDLGDVGHRDWRCQRGVSGVSVCRSFREKGLKK